MKQEINAILLFVTELTGSYKAGTGTVETKIQCGRHDYITNNLPELNLSTEEDRKDLNELMWLERLYDELDSYFSISSGCNLSRSLSFSTNNYRDIGYKFSVPIELDASCSLLQIMGVLLNDKRMMEMTNVIGATLEDPWKIEGVPRLLVKKSMTPKLYGSSASPVDLWRKVKLDYTPKHIEIINNELKNGAFGLANMFKDFIIHNCKPKAKMQIKIGHSEFEVSCNKFRNVGEATKAYKIWDSVDKTYNTLLHTDTKKIADLEQFRLYQVTLLVHHLDSVMMDSVTSKVMEKYQFAIPIHDALVCSPAAAEDVRGWYNEELLDIHANRDVILSGFFRSIGITSASTEKWSKVKAKIVPFTGNLAEEFSLPLK